MTKLRLLRQERGLQRKFVAEKIGITPRYLNYLEAGETKLTAKHALELSKLYGLGIEEIIEAFDKTKEELYLDGLVEECKNNLKKSQ